MRPMIQLTEMNSNAEVFVYIDDISAVSGANPNQIYNNHHAMGMSMPVASTPMPSLASIVHLHGGSNIYVSESPKHVMLLIKEAQYGDQVNKAIVT